MSKTQSKAKGKKPTTGASGEDGMRQEVVPPADPVIDILRSQARELPREDWRARNRFEGVFIFDIQNGNPNGDPDQDDKPRRDPRTGIGSVSAQSIKRKIRDVAAANFGADIFVAANVSDETGRMQDRATRVQQMDQAYGPEFRAQLGAQFWDNRMFGYTITGLKQRHAPLHGPLQICHGFSIDPIDILSNPLTCSSPAKYTTDAEGNEGARGTGMMGKMPAVRYGLYKMSFTFTPSRAVAVTDEDIKTLWQAVQFMFSETNSSRREIHLRRVVIFKHQTRLGNAPKPLLMDCVRIQRKQDVDVVKSIDDYLFNVELPEAIRQRGVQMINWSPESNKELWQAFEETGDDNS